MAILVVLFAASAFWTRSADFPGRVPRDVWLRTQPVRLYMDPLLKARPRAILVFFGNDVGFWRPHQRLASDLASWGYAVAGVDIVPLLGALPPAPGARDSVFRARVALLIGRAYLELVTATRDASDGTRHTRTVPLVLLGHSLGSEVALRIGAEANGATRWPHGVPRIAGVVALSPGSRSHLRVAMEDLLMSGEPIEPGSFAVADVVTGVVASPGHSRVAIVRGAHDALRSADPALLAAGGPKARRFIVPWAGHSLARLTVSRLVVRRALDWVLEDVATH